jgi:hypothetical protein
MYATAEEPNTKFEVSAHVAAHAVVELVNWPVDVHITTNDVRAGYKDVMLRYVVRSNDRRGVIVRLTPLRGFATSMAIDGLSQSLVLQESELEIWQKSDARTELHVRFHLIQGLVPGTYPLPLMVAISPVSSHGTDEAEPP